MKALMLILPEEIYDIGLHSCVRPLGVDEQEGVLRRQKHRTMLSNGNVETFRFRWFWLNEKLAVLGVMNAIDCCRNDAGGAYVWVRRARE
jgi:hypothetical protein